ncbi:cyclic peptide export ABC transporter [Pyxidicoccus fallax]|uniref:Cyclic peptide export ABC transporter n=1 Tax=Pyxidicoccus fallax TaxID=394095 RepID=A0A848LR62_9BACT|nr:cyclic peptide export ABC transporter [Pyxidicoccus fallax]NMO20130.1 cyclic peptide export ABC transporter [Pyxidicoccus fallax]NPC80854.1 cyclic peptide export ABC transporter [Pyxidicoccus fallax]
MTLLALLFRRSKGPILLAVVLGVLAGAAGAGLVWAINRALTSQTPAQAWSLLPAFAALAVASLMTRLLSQMQLNVLQQQVVEDLRLDLCERILRAPLRKLEEAGSHRVLAALTDDIFVISSAISTAPYALINLATVAGGFVYLAYLSGTVLMLMLGVIAVAGASVVLPIRFAYRQLHDRREQHDRLFSGFRSLVDGTKELQLHQDRREDFFERELKASAQAVTRSQTRSNNIFLVTANWGGFMLVAVIGAILFGIPRFLDVEMSTLVGYTLVVLYVQSPLDSLATQLPLLARSQVAIKKLEKLGLSLEDPTKSPPRKVEAPTTFERLELAGITHSYYREHEDGHFTLGPLDLTLRRGELVFLVGGNGSGKTTLAKLLTGLYAPEAGEIRVDGVPVTSESRAAYRQLFTAVFYDFHLFERLLGLSRPELMERAREYLARLHLDRKVRLEEDRLSTTSLSQGQRKRLALLTAYLEDRPIYVFDEWAADQDPVFRELFYRELLPELRGRGKLVFVISHDDRYFHLADRVIKLEAGRLVPDVTQTSVNTAISA